MLLRKGLVAKLHNIGYLNRGIVFAADLLMASVSALFSLMIIYFFQGEGYYRVAQPLVPVVALTVAVSAGLFLLTSSYKTSIRCSTLRELSKIFGLLVAKGFLMALLIVAFGIFHWKYAIVYAVLDMLIASFIMLSSRAFMVSLYHMIVNTGTAGKNAGNTFIYGAQGHAPLLAAQINDDVKSPYRIIGFLSPDLKNEKVRIAGQCVYCWDGDPEGMAAITARHNVSNILFTNITDFNRERDRLVDFCIEHNIQMLMGGEVQPMDKNKNISNHIKPVDIEDLLYREEIDMDESAVSEQVRGKIVLVTGAAGSIGHQIAVQLARFDTKRLILLDIAETPLHDMELELKKEFPGKDIVFLLGDVRSKNRIMKVFEQYRPDYVFHAAAYKHVPVVESYPCEGVLTNVSGTLNTASCAMLSGVGKFVMISTDKAINPTNVMGASKRIAELLVQGLNAGRSNTRFIITRFGNVLGSNGSVIPIFKEQIARGGPVTVTHPEMTRYFMTISEACKLVLQAATMGSGGEIFVFDMGQQVKIDNLARRMILLSGLVPDEDVRIEYTGLRPGEKLYEELLTKAESTKLTENQKIRIVLVDDVDAEAIRDQVSDLIRAAESVDVKQTVRLMKRILPEFKSNNSEFEVLDREEMPARQKHDHEKRAAETPCPDIAGLYHP